MSAIVNYCPECRAEYREGFTTCCDCNVPLVRRLASETGDRLVPLTRESSFEFVGELLDRLEKHEVPYVIQAGTALRLLDEQAEITEPQSWEARIWVTRSREQIAVEILEELRSEWRFEHGSQTANRYLE